MKKIALLLALVLSSQAVANPDIWNPVAFIGQAVLGATAGAPLAVDANGLMASGLTTIEVTATADLTTTATADTTMTGMTTTPAAATWMVFFSGCVDHSAQSVNVIVSLYVGGSQVAHTIRSPVPRFNALGANSLNPCLSFTALATVNGSQAVTVEWHGSGAGTSTIHQRTLHLLRIL